MNRKLILTTIFLCFTLNILSQTGINYQGAATNSEGAKLVNQNISLRTSVLQGGVDGTTSYSETHNTTTDQFGLFNVIIGLGNVVTGSFDSIQWGLDAHFLKIELDATGGTDYNLVSTTQMMSVPYAKYAENINLDNLNLNQNITQSLNNNLITIQCVEMGISAMCGGFGLINDDLSSDENMRYQISTDTNSENGYFESPHWRKFKINNLTLDSNEQLMFKRQGSGGNPGYISTNSVSYLTPEIEDGNVYFYIYSYCSGNCCPDECNSESNIFLSIPGEHSLFSRWTANYCSYNSGYNWDTWQIYYPLNGSWKDTGIYFKTIN